MTLIASLRVYHLLQAGCPLHKLLNLAESTLISWGAVTLPAQIWGLCPLA